MRCPDVFIMVLTLQPPSKKDVLPSFAVSKSRMTRLTLVEQRITRRYASQNAHLTTIYKKRYTALEPIISLIIVISG